MGFHVQEITANFHSGSNPERSESGIPNPWLGAPYGLYHTKDGYIAIGMNSVQKLAQIVGLPKYDSKKFASNNVIESRDEIRFAFDVVFQMKRTDEWLEILMKEEDLVLSGKHLEEMVKDLQIKHNEMIIEIDHPVLGKVKTTGFPVWFSETPQKIYKPAPPLNGNAKEILKEICSYGDDFIDTFIKENNQK